MCVSSKKKTQNNQVPETMRLCYCDSYLCWEAQKFVVVFLLAWVCPAQAVDAAPTCIDTSVSAEVQVRVSRASVRQWISHHQRAKNLAKGCNSLSFGLLFVEKVSKWWIYTGINHKKIW